MAKEKKNKVRISNSSINTYGSRVLTEGVDFSQFQRNPILLWMHRRGEVDSIVGSVINIAVEGDDLVGELVFDGIGETSKMISEKWEKGTLRMVSANFDIVELSDDPEHVLTGQKAFTVTKSKLVEVSVVDIGGNDDALVLLRKDGQSIALSNEDNGLTLPMLGGNKTTNKLDDMDFKTIALKLGLPETATEQEILDAISVAQDKAKDSDELKTEVESIRLANITSLVDSAITARKVGADKKEHFITLGKQIGAESLKLTFESMATQMKPTDIVGGGVPLSGSAGDWKKLSEVPADKLMELRDNDKDTYMRLYKAEYGVDCKI